MRFSDSVPIKKKIAPNNSNWSSYQKLDSSCWSF